MAIYFNLGLVTRTRADADACGAFFLAQSLVVDDAVVKLEAFVHARARDFLLGVWPRGMSYGSPNGNNRRLTTDAARERIACFFDAALIQAPRFAAGFFGGEAYDYFLDDEPLESQLEGGFGGLYVDDDLWTALGRPADAVRVRPTRYGWPRTRPE